MEPTLWGIVPMGYTASPQGCAVRTGSIPDYGQEALALSAMVQRTSQIAHLEKNVEVFEAQALACLAVARRLRNSPCENEYEQKVTISLDRRLLQMAAENRENAAAAKQRVAVLRMSIIAATEESVDKGHKPKV